MKRHSKSSKSAPKYSFRRVKVVLFKHKRILKYSSILLLILITGVSSLFLVPKEYEKTEQSIINFSSETKDEIALELGTFQTAEEGRAGLTETKYKYRQSLFDYLFRKDKVTKTEVGTTTLTEPESKIILKGTRKWQYMMCSDGGYRYFSDEEFKNPNTGFTNSSPDHCEINKQGKKVSLADTPQGVNNNTQPSYTPESCKYTSIPRSTVYKDASWLDVGQTQRLEGADGFQYTCSNGKYYPPIKPVDNIIYKGTYVAPTYNYSDPYDYTYEETPQGPDYNAKYKCDSDYSSAKAQLQMANAGNSSAMLQVEQLYAQCLSRAGF